MLKSFTAQGINIKVLYDTGVRELLTPCPTRPQARFGRVQETQGLFIGTSLPSSVHFELCSEKRKKIV